MKLLIATTVPVTIRAFLLPFADHFRQKGWTVDAMAADISSSEELAPHFDSLIDMPWSRSPLDLKNLSLAPRIRGVASDGGYDIVHVHTPVASFVTRYALRKAAWSGAGRPKVIYTAHGFHFHRGGSAHRNFIFRTLEKAAGRWTDHLVVINRDDYDASKRYGIVPEERLTLMPGIGLDFAKYNRAAVSEADINETRAKLGLKPNDVLFTMIAEFNPGKRHWDVLTALAAVGRTDIHLAFAGVGALFEEMRKMASGLALGERVHFLGHVNDIKPLILASSATIFSSEREGLSRAAMESVCLGVPVIGSDVRGISDVVKDSRGILYPVGDCPALRNAMTQIADTPYGAVTPDPAWRIENLIEIHDGLYEKILA